MEGSGLRWSGYEGGLMWTCLLEFGFDKFGGISWRGNEN
jgi:hypothetical protein